MWGRTTIKSIPNRYQNLSPEEVVKSIKIGLECIPQPKKWIHPNLAEVEEDYTNWITPSPSPISSPGSTTNTNRAARSGSPIVLPDRAPSSINYQYQVAHKMRQEEFLPLFKFILNNTTIVTFDTFYSDLLCVFAAFVSFILQSHPNTEIWAPYEPRKSSHWLLYLLKNAMSKTDIPKVPLHWWILPHEYDEDSEYSEYIDRTNWADINNRVVVLFDDMMYSGKQMKDKVVNILKYGHPESIYIVAPYISSYVCEEFGKNLAKNFKDQDIRKCPIHLIFLYELMTAYELAGENVSLRKSLKTIRFYKYRVPIVFDHKIPDNLSSFPEVYEEVLSHTIPPYKSCRDLFSRGKQLESPRKIKIYSTLLTKPTRHKIFPQNQWILRRPSVSSIAPVPVPSVSSIAQVSSLRTTLLTKRTRRGKVLKRPSVSSIGPVSSLRTTHAVGSTAGTSPVQVPLGRPTRR
jgi:hypothetical protein